MDLRRKRIIIACAAGSGMRLKRALENFGAEAYGMPCVKILKSELTRACAGALENLEIYDWIVFTSARGMPFFLKHVKACGVDEAPLRAKNLAAVGPATEASIKKCGYGVSFIPSEFQTAVLGRELPDVSGRRVLLARADIASPELRGILENRGADVTELPVYKTELISARDEKFEKFLLNGAVDLVVFMSASAVEGMLKRVSDAAAQEALFRVPAASIGPVTAARASEKGFARVVTARENTVGGIINILHES